MNAKEPSPDLEGGDALSRRCAERSCSREQECEEETARWKT